MTKEYLKDYAIELILRAIEEGEEHGSVGVVDDETGNEHRIEWDLHVEIEYMNEE